MNKILKILYIVLLILVYPWAWVYNCFDIALKETNKDFMDAIKEGGE